MKFISAFYLTVFVPMIFPISAHALKRVECDALEKTTSRFDDNMINRDVAVNKWAQCWEHSLNVDLDERLIPLKKSDEAEFKAEMDIQKAFNVSLKKMCSRNCNSSGSGMKGISYNFCRVEGYRYRTAQTIEIRENALTIPNSENLGAKKSRDKTKQTKYFTDFIHKLCQLPKNLWKDSKVPADCEKKATEELDGLELTDDVCDLS